ncbi:M15 family metallopeptidase [Marinobacterium jannaschii]|uniref:M15 family metallopeptidase n=1 Tax=Marinobacterium jannaschii TaxID=64970 RepID=UPI0005636D84|nr:M15 family metallopeptidase [Marinobacterium jannaschii]
MPQRSPRFVELQQFLPTIVLDMKYAGRDNFIGQPVCGYEQAVCWLSYPAAKALGHVQQALAEMGLGLKVFDGYRPQRAVDHFMRWADEPCDARSKARFYPDIDKAGLFREGYLMSRSSHSRGSTVDLTLIDLASAAELEMGSEFDFFGAASWIDAQSVSAQARANRMLLQELMVRHGFVPYYHEWWHFTLQDEPYPETYFDQPIGSRPPVMD